MRHPNTERFAADWRARRGARPVPHRRDLDPALFGALAPQLFMLGAGEDGGELFRVAGALLVDLHGRDLAGTPFARLWARPDREPALDCVGRARRAAAPLVLTAEGATAEGAAVELEVTLAPVLGPSGAPDRTFGLYQPVTPLAWLQGATLGGLRLRGITTVADPRPAHLKLVAVEGRRVA